MKSYLRQINLLCLKISFAFLLLLASYLKADEGLKVICASHTDEVPVIDGIMDEACWSKAEIRSDFTSPGSGEGLQRRTEMKVLYDRNNLYFGFKVYWNDAQLLRDGIATIKSKHSDIKSNVWMKKWKYENIYGLEVFLDPGAGGLNYYQLLFNAAGQCVGNYKGMLKHFNIKPIVKSTVKGKCWTVELKYFAENLQAGQEWGLNVCRNDETYYGIWKQVNGAYGNPKLFGRLILGDYREWWDAVGGKNAMKALDAMEDEQLLKKDPFYQGLFKDTRNELSQFCKWAEQYPPTSRENFEKLYTRYSKIHAKLDRLRVYYETLRLFN
jgi:hypothetical protein